MKHTLAGSGKNPPEEVLTSWTLLPTCSWFFSSFMSSSSTLCWDSSFRTLISKWLKDPQRDWITQLLHGCQRLPLVLDPVCDTIERDLEVQPGKGTSELHLCSVQMMCFCRDLQREMGWFIAKCEAAGTRIRTSHSENMALCEKTLGKSSCPKQKSLSSSGTCRKWLNHQVLEETSWWETGTPNSDSWDVTH